MDRGGLLLRGASFSSAMCHSFLTNYKCSNSYFGFPNWITINYNKVRSCSQITTRSSLQPPDLVRLAETARISLTPAEAEEFAPKFQQMIDWFGQLQGVDLQSIEPSIRADTEDNNLREDVPETFEHRDTMIAAVPSFEEPYIKVPKVLNME